MHHKVPFHYGFTLIELIIVIAIIGVLFMVVLVAINPTRIIEESRLSQAKEHLNFISQAMEAYYIVHNGEYPPDANRNQMPAGLEGELKTGQWPQSPWGQPTSYDWDNINEDGEQYYQISLRFCDAVNTSDCNFPDFEWAEDFDSNSSVYWCMEGPCRAHRNSSPTHPALCINCREGEFTLE